MLTLNIDDMQVVHLVYFNEDYKAPCTWKMHKYQLQVSVIHPITYSL